MAVIRDRQFVQGVNILRGDEYLLIRRDQRMKERRRREDVRIMVVLDFLRRCIPTEPPRWEYSDDLKTS